MLNKVTLIIVGLLLNIISINVFANNAVKEYTFCNSCTTDESYRYVATRYLELGYDKSVYILNIKQEQIRKFRVVSFDTSQDGFANEPGMPVYINNVRQVSVESTKQTLFDESMELRKLAVRATDNLVVPKEIAGSVYDLVGATYVVNDIADYYNNRERKKNHTWFSFSG